MAHHLLEQIKIITARETWPLRHQVMWPNMPFDYVKLINDAEGIHYGLLVNDNLVSVVSLFIDKNKKAQFRKLATLPKYQGKGFASKLIHKIFEYSKENNIAAIWCNARKDKLSFYQKFGMIATKKEYTKENVEFVILEKKLKI